jgi:hypothetical protein
MELEDDGCEYDPKTLPSLFKGLPMYHTVQKGRIARDSTVGSAREAREAMEMEERK